MSNTLDEPNLSPQEIFKLKWVLFAKNAIKQLLYLSIYSVLAYFILFKLNIIEQLYNKIVWSLLYAFLAYYISVVTLAGVLFDEDKDKLVKLEKHIKYASFFCCFFPTTFVYYCLLEKNVRTEIILFRIDFYLQIEVTPMLAACSLTIICIGLNNIWLYIRFASEKSIVKFYSE
jgi:Na+/citrate or Na+/malate symporter